MKIQNVSKKLDSLYEFDREPVKKKNLQGLGNFLGLYAGEHVAGTEFIIGILLVTHGVSATDLLIGGLIGNGLAVLSWALVTAPIAVRTRLSLYWQLKKICGPYIVFIYNIVNALMFCFLAGAMVSVSATAIGIPFNIDMPGLNDWLPNSTGWVLSVLFVGSVITTLAILGFESVARFAKTASPWMILIFIASGIAGLANLGVGTEGSFWEIATTKIWTGEPMAGKTHFTIWHVIFFTWLTNAAMHIGMSDLSILRYAKKWQYGFASAVGMFLGHYVAWIASGVLCAAAMGEVAPGPVAQNIAGTAGAVCVIIAGWTTANPTLYRAGLALQVASPNWRRWKVTLFAGLLTTIAALFPALVMNLLDFVALYGLVLVPMGGVIFADFWLLPKFNLIPYYTERTNRLINYSAGLTWVIMMLLAIGLYKYANIDIFFLSAPIWAASILLYLYLSKYLQIRTPKIE